MSILIDKNTKVITQGITGKTGQFHTRMCRDYANGKACFVAGVNPKKAGEDFEGIPIYANVTEAAQATGATVSVIYVPPAGAACAPVFSAGVPLLSARTSGAPAGAGALASSGTGFAAGAAAACVGCGLACWA